MSAGALERLRLEASGLTFDALAAGPHDGRVVLLLHGFPQTSRSWRGVMERLAAAGCRAVAPDQRGYSPDARPDGPQAYTQEALVSDVLGLAGALGTTRFELVGHDWGGVVAWRTAIAHPERVRTLTAVSTPHPRSFGRAIRADEDQQRRSAYMLLLARAGEAERVLSENGFARLRRLYGSGDVDPEDVDHYVQRLSAPGALTAALNWYRAPVVRGLPSEVTVPTLYVWSTEDPALGRTAAEGTAEHVTGPYRFVELEGVSHWIPDAEPQRLADEILAHLDEHG